MWPVRSVPKRTVAHLYPVGRGSHSPLDDAGFLPDLLAGDVEVAFLLAVGLILEPACVLNLFDAPFEFAIERPRIDAAVVALHKLGCLPKFLPPELRDALLLTHRVKQSVTKCKNVGEQSASTCYLLSPDTVVADAQSGDDTLLI